MTTYAKTKTTTMPTLAIRNGIPAEFESLFRPLHSERHIPETPLEQTRQYRLRIGRAALRSLSEIRPSRVVALATVIAAGVNLGIAIGVQLKDTMEGRPDHPEAAAPAKPGQEQKEQEDAGQTNKKRAPKDQQSQHPVGPTKQPQPNKTVDITDTETVAKAIATNKELPKVGPGKTELPVETTESPDVEQPHTPTPSDIPEPVPRVDETASPEKPEPKPSETTPEGQPSSLPSITPSANNTSPIEATPTLESTGSGSATALPTTILVSR